MRHCGPLFKVFRCNSRDGAKTYSEVNGRFVFSK